MSSTGLVTTLFPATPSSGDRRCDRITVLTVSAPVLKQVDGTGPAGSLGVNVDDSPFRDTHAYGFSYYTAITTVNPSNAAATQLGWGVWIEPNNLSFTQPLCPVGTTSRDQFTDRAASFYRDVYQTMQGGAGYWGNVQFPTPTSVPAAARQTRSAASGGYQMNVNVTPTASHGAVEQPAARAARPARVHAVDGVDVHGTAGSAAAHSGTRRRSAWPWAIRVGRSFSAR